MTPLNPYPAYKPSGVPWLGDVPRHWEVLPGRACYTSKQILNQGMLEKSVLSLSYGQIKIRPEEKLHGLVPASFETYQFVEPEDIVCRPTDLQNDWNSLRFGFSRHRGIITSAYMCLRTRAELSRRFGYLLLHTYDLKKVFYGLGSGLRQNLSWTDFKLLPCLVPPSYEQAAIVRYLDHVDRRIRRYVTAKRKLIAVLEEEMQAVINQAVTRGLDPNVRLKPSGVEWLGDVPEHWTLPRLRNLGDALIGLTYDPQDVVDEADGILVLRASNILAGKLVYGDNVFVRSAVPDKLVTREGDILICSRSGSRALIGKNVRINAESAGTTFGAFMTVFRGANNDYLHLVFNSKFFEYQSAAFFTSTINQLTLGILYGMKVPFPPLEESQLILRYVEESTAPIIKAIAHTRRQIKLIQEYRTRLISDVVTGKLDVREAAALLPDEADDEEPMDESGPLGDSVAEDLQDPGEWAEELAMESEVTV